MGVREEARTHYKSTGNGRTQRNGCVRPQVPCFRASWRQCVRSRFLAVEGEALQAGFRSYQPRLHFDALNSIAWCGPGLAGCDFRSVMPRWKHPGSTMFSTLCAGSIARGDKRNEQG